MVFLCDEAVLSFPKAREWSLGRTREWKIFLEEFITNDE